MLQIHLNISSSSHTHTHKYTRTGSFLPCKRLPWRTAGPNTKGCTERRAGDPSFPGLQTHTQKPCADSNTVTLWGVMVLSAAPKAPSLPPLLPHSSSSSAPSRPPLLSVPLPQMKTGPHRVCHRLIGQAVTGVDTGSQSERERARKAECEAKTGGSEREDAHSQPQHPAGAARRETLRTCLSSSSFLFSSFLFPSLLPPGKTGKSGVRIPLKWQDHQDKACSRGGQAEQGPLIRSVTWSRRPSAAAAAASEFRLLLSTRDERTPPLCSHLAVDVLSCGRRQSSPLPALADCT